MLMLGMQLLTGIFLTMYYKPDAANAVSYTHLTLPTKA